MKKILSMLVVIFILASMIILPVSAADATLNVTYAANGIFNVTGTVEGDGSYKLIMADYAADGTFLGATTEELTVANGAFATTVDFSANDKQLVSTKLMVWDMTTATPVAETVVNPKANGGVNVATSDRAKTGGKGMKGGYLVDPASNLIDGDDDTTASFYAQNAGETGYMYVDLYGYYEIDRIEVLSYSNAPTLANPGARGTEYDIVLGTELPDGTAFDAENPNGEVKVAFVKYDDSAVDKNVGYKTFYVPADAGKQRYVSFEKWEEGRAGLRIAEVKVYVSEESAANVIENVALGKSVAGNALILSTLEHGSSNGLATVTDGKMYSENKKQFISQGKGIYQLDLGSYYDVEKVMVDAVGDEYSSNITVYLAKEPYSATTGFPKEKTTIIEGTDAWGTDSKFIDLETPVNARYIMFWKSDAAIRIGEIEVWGKENVPATNIALGKIGELSAGNEIPSISKGTASVTDGVLSATNGAYLCSYLPAVYTLDLKSFYDIEKILIDCQYIGCTDELTVYLADAPYSTTTGLPANRTTVIKATADNWDAVTKTVTLDTPVNARYVIVHRAATNVNYTHFRLGELEVWGK